MATTSILKLFLNLALRQELTVVLLAQLDLRVHMAVLLVHKARQVLQALKAKVLQLKAQLPLLVICLLLAINRAIHTLFNLMGIFTLGLVPCGLMLALSLAQLVLLEPQGRLVLQALKAFKAIMDQQVHKVFRAFKAIKAHKVSKAQQVRKAFRALQAQLVQWAQLPQSLAPLVQQALRGLLEQLVLLERKVYKV